MNTVLKKNNFNSDLIKRKSFKQKEIFFNTINMLKESKFSPNIRYGIYLGKKNFTFFSCIKNRCIVSGRSRAIFSKFKLSRIQFSQKVISGKICGFYKSVW